jgi:hypothetical protein
VTVGRCGQVGGLATALLLTAWALAAPDAGAAARVTADAGGQASVQDRELLDNLEFLRNMDLAQDFELLLELSKPPP